MTRKITSIVFPVTIGILLSIIFLQIRQSALEYLYPELYDDAVFLFEPLFDIDIFLPVYGLAYFAAIIFQLFIGLKIWNIYKQNLKIFHLELWQLTIYSCLLFGIAFGCIVWYRQSGVEDLFFKILTGTLLAITYWTGNFLTLLVIDRKLYDKEQKKM